MNEQKYWVAFHQVSGIGPVSFSKLESHFGEMSKAWDASSAEIAAAGLSAKLVKKIDQFRNDHEPDEIAGKLSELGITAVHLRHPDYPQQLLETAAAPSVIYTKGDVSLNSEPMVAVVGSRDATPYGLEMPRRLSYDLASDLASAGVTVVSGLARGIDTAAHKAALEAGGRTVAILGSGLDKVYPQRNIGIAKKIAERGALLTEYPPGVSALPQHFPRRNRVISGICKGVLVVEAAFKSGAMLTVSWALEQNREVFAVRGSALSEKSKGTNWLIQQGAKLTTTVEDIVEELNIEAKTISAEPQKNARGGEIAIDNLARENNVLNIERRIIELLGNSAEPVHVDDITRELGESAAEISSVLVMLELRGTARQVAPMQFIIDSERPVVT
jgi:DNA processing protein